MSSETHVPPQANEIVPQAAVKRSAAEEIKENSQQLRGTIAEELCGDGDHFNEENKQLLKFHGSYQYEDRDGARTGARTDRRKNTGS